MALASGNRKSNRRGFLTLALGAMALAACTPQIDYRGYQPRGNDLDNVRQGMTKAEVEALLGSPSTTATIAAEGDSYYYISSKLETTAFLTPVETERRVLAIRFDANDQVASFGNYGLQDGKVINFNPNATPTKGKELTVIQQLLTNAGRFDGGGPTGGGVWQ
jgi:outer membrane protein assembly factor BamE (lipoprotein component of BamABCDE complex)